jgi:hypothetical protein
MAGSSLTWPVLPVPMAMMYSDEYRYSRPRSAANPTESMP